VRCVHTCMLLCAYTYHGCYMYVCVCVMYVCTHRCLMYIFCTAYIYMCACMYSRRLQESRPPARARTHTHTRARTTVGAISAYTHTCMQDCTNVCMSASVGADVLAYLRVFMRMCEGVFVRRMHICVCAHTRCV
jgi:hypothetical protein